jgi:pimeloyl-ACP methyl ester carboxylesterase
MDTAALRPWFSDAPQSLEDQARLVEAALPTNADIFCFVGHSFGGSVAMKLAAGLSGRISRLVLLEINSNAARQRHLRSHGIAQLHQEIPSLGEWVTAAEHNSPTIGAMTPRNPS